MKGADNILSEFLKRPIAYQPILAKAFGSVKLGIFWSQLYYWHDKGSDPEGWIYKTSAQMADETGLSRKEQETARKLGMSLGIIEEKLAGQPATIHYRIDIDAAMAVLENYIASQRQGQLKIIQDKPSGHGSLGYLRQLPDEDKEELAAKYGVPHEFVSKCAEDVIDYCEAKGKTYRDYKAALRNFIKSSTARYSGRGGMTL